MSKKALTHIAFIPDGNGRWANIRQLPRTCGHDVGYQTALKILHHCIKIKIPYVTLFALSYYNVIKRGDDELQNIYRHLRSLFKDKEIDLFHRLNCVFRPIGDFSCLTKCPELIDAINYAIDKTRNNTGTVINIAVAYAGSTDIADSIYEIYRQNDNHLPEKRDDLIKGISHHSSLRSPPVDLFIRLGGEKRLSDFCFWHLLQAELEFLDTLWPDFTVAQLDNCIKNYHNRDRRFGEATSARIIRKLAKERRPQSGSRCSNLRSDK
ncbi:di-trans,poly-cis-decaprenylcistransferase [Legionella taurinensis]|uniref:Ditrans,polycis-undecaprenyl-diphosphate synthase ((2E,6E)-farnesyl-diphosphate specific) n=1 Tax=Legionella taurinensis TaxID=70611 RepID=A0A3A5LBR0_9GAMM|nr:polyprenyl diphosphate synthase [Legionella taurinensis]MDX1836016.1 polyprenyl diphosphate synthase [Legionella taurinensis]PUT38723.1 di-trans,poly-cis-decaprenylcistransferase [Legionella taurinensis]PUT40102.1 di-trans,poly-cis-decaprenylcistransferase [Legionella taurinensis]PUT42254.1 di-trans,poly-cis-decaprenylcistransferase [Legionella taurinensis]PUT46026.1 di-trans,poly-cis-decaprenylcistransferase [Legionella taurinensis]